VRYPTEGQDTVHLLDARHGVTVRIGCFAEVSTV
jgi:hypothetical protein